MQGSWVGIEVRAEKTGIFVFYRQNVGRSHNIKTANKSFKKVLKTYLE